MGGVGLAVAVPSLIGACMSQRASGVHVSGARIAILRSMHAHLPPGGTRRAVVNGVLAAGATAGVFGFSEWWERRHQEEEGGAGGKK